MRVAGVDPGRKKTGMVLLELEEDGLGCRVAVEAASIEEVLYYLDLWQPDVVVIEAFRLYPWRSRALGWDPMLPSQIIGAVKAWASRRECAVQVVEQPASVRKLARLHTGQLEKLPLFRGKPHARDALRHAVWYVLHHWPKKVFYVRWE